jgi:hypothetical protein
MNVLYLCSAAAVPALVRVPVPAADRALLTAFTAAGHDVVMPVTRLESTARAARRHAIHGDSEDEYRRVFSNEQLEVDVLAALAGSPPDLVYERAALHGTVGATVALALRVPLVVELSAPLAHWQRSYGNPRLSAIGVAAERKTLHAASLVVTPSSALRRYAVARGVPEPRIVLLPEAPVAAERARDVRRSSRMVTLAARLHHRGARTPRIAAPAR